MRTEAFIARDGTVATVRGDNGPPVLLIHGLGLTRAMWEAQIDELGTAFRLVTYDLYGHGDSPAPPEKPTLSLFAHQAVSVLDSLSCTRAAVVGFSLGGMIARRLAMDVPERVAALAILNSPHLRSADARAAIQARVDQVRRDGPVATVDAALVRWFTDAFRQARPDMMDRVRGWVLANDPAVYAPIYQVLVDGVDELAAAATRITCPTLVMTADEDHGNGPEMTWAIAARIPGARVHILDGLRHMAPMEAPDRVNAEIETFLTTALQAVAP